MALLKHKAGVVIAGLQYEMRVVRILYASMCAYIEAQGEITSGLEGEHSAGSYHPYGYALDLSIKEMTKAQARSITSQMKNTLGEMYDVVLEKDHIHVEFDVARAKLLGYKKEF